MPSGDFQDRTGEGARASIESTGSTIPAEQFADRTLVPNVVGFLHRPASPPRDALVLTHGAGSNCRAPFLVSLAEAFSSAGILVLRCDLPFRQNSPTGPPRPGNAELDQQGLGNAVNAVRKLVPGRVMLGGSSYGGRQATLLASSQPDLVSGLLLLSYPLHPPGKPQQLRVQHFPQLRTPALFVHGTRDPFGSPEELTKALPLIPAGTDLLLIDGGGHGLETGKKAGKKAKGHPETPLPESVRVRFQEFFRDR